MFNEEDFLLKIAKKCLELISRAIEIAMQVNNENKLPEEFLSYSLDFLLICVANDEKTIDLFFQMENLKQFLFNSILLKLIIIFVFFSVFRAF